MHRSAHRPLTEAAACQRMTASFFVSSGVALTRVRQTSNGSQPETGFTGSSNSSFAAESGRGLAKRLSTSKDVFILRALHHRFCCVPAGLFLTRRGGEILVPSV